MPETAPPMSRICLRPPALKANGRFGLANRRSLTASVALVTATGGATFGLAGACGLGAGTTWRPAVAGAVGAGSFLGRCSSRATLAADSLRALGTGYPVESL